jgi:hypothetical protein
MTMTMAKGRRIPKAKSTKVARKKMEEFERELAMEATPAIEAMIRAAMDDDQPKATNPPRTRL